MGRLEFSFFINTATKALSWQIATSICAVKALGEAFNGNEGESVIPASGARPGARGARRPGRARRLALSEVVHHPHNDDTVRSAPFRTSANFTFSKVRKL